MDNLTKQQRHKNMSNIRSYNTLPERLLRRELKKNKLYFSRNVKNIIGKPDFVSRKNRLAVFVDSDFWHGHPRRFIMPKSNLNYWKKKIQRNKARDKEVTRLLKSKGWKVIRCWEYDIKHNLKKCMHKIYNEFGY